MMKGTSITERPDISDANQLPLAYSETLRNITASLLRKRRNSRPSVLTLFRTDEDGLIARCLQLAAWKAMHHDTAYARQLLKASKQVFAVHLPILFLI
jgi:hypothetical protein